MLKHMREWTWGELQPRSSSSKCHNPNLFVSLLILDVALTRCSHDRG